jgi:hypothetical protein
VATTIDSTALFFGAAASLTVGGDEVGATLTPPKVTIEATQYAPEFQGAGGPISGAVFNTKIKASVEFDVNELTAAKLAWSLPGSTSAVGTGSTTAGPDDFATTLDGNTAIGDTLLPVADTTDGGSSVTIAAGMFIKIGTGGTAEFRIVKAIAAGAAIEVTEALAKAHLSGVAVVRVDDLDVTTISWNTGRVDSTVFKDVVLDGIGLDGRHLVVTITDALSDGKLDFEMSDAAVAGSHVVMTGYYDGANPTLAPVTIAVG